jgi:hypothetical protein
LISYFFFLPETHSVAARPPASIGTAKINNTRCGGKVNHHPFFDPSYDQAFDYISRNNDEKVDIFDKIDDNGGSI